jgi:hypothetical protein
MVTVEMPAINPGEWLPLEMPAINPGEWLPKMDYGGGCRMRDACGGCVSRRPTSGIDCGNFFFYFASSGRLPDVRSNFFAYFRDFARNRTISEK